MHKYKSVVTAGLFDSSAFSVTLHPLTTWISLKLRFVLCLLHICSKDKTLQQHIYSHSCIFCTIAVLNIGWGKEKASVTSGSNFSSLTRTDLGNSPGFVIKTKQDSVGLWNTDFTVTNSIINKQWHLHTCRFQKNVENKSPTLPGKLMEDRKNDIAFILHPHK